MAWVERMREAKARGEISRFPGGRRARDLPKLSKDKTIRKAQRIIEKAKAVAEQQIAKTEGMTWEELSHSEKLTRQTGTALNITAKILNEGARLLDQNGLEGMDIKLLTLVKDTAMQSIGTQVRVDSARLAASGFSRGGPPSIAEIVSSPPDADEP
jgi:hypothetical protein